MKITSKNYTYFKIKKLLKLKTTILIFDSNIIKVKDWLLIEQTLHDANFQYYRASAKSIKRVLSQTIFKHYSNLINSQILLVFPKDDTNYSLDVFKQLKSKLTFLSLIHKKKVYSAPQIGKINSLNPNSVYSALNKLLINPFNCIYSQLVFYRQNILKSE